MKMLVITENGWILKSITAEIRTKTKVQEETLHLTGSQKENPEVTM